MTQERTIITTKKACAEFLNARAEGLTRRTLRTYQEVLDLWVEYLDDRGIATIDLTASTAAGRRTGTIEQVLALLDEFNDDYLVSAVRAERDFLRSAGLVSRDFSRWLKSLTPRPSRREGESMAGRLHA